MYNKAKYILFISALTLLISSCRKRNIPPAPVFVNITFSSEYISHTPQSLTFRVNFVILDSRFDGNITGMNIRDFLYIGTYTGGGSGATYTYRLDSFKLAATPLKGAHSTAVMFDLSEIEESDYANKGAKYLIGQETACRKFLKNTSPESNFIVSAYAGNNPYLPSQPVTVFGNGFISNGVFYDQILAGLRRYENTGGTTPFLKATDYILEYINQFAPNNNRQIVAFTHSEDDEGGFTWNSIISKARNYNVPCNIIMTYQNTPDFYEYLELAGETGGFVFFVENHQDGGNIPLFGEQLDNILTGNFQCFETVWTVQTDKPVFSSGFAEGGYIELYMDTEEKVYTYMPYFLRIP